MAPLTSFASFDALFADTPAEYRQVFEGRLEHFRSQLEAPMRRLYGEREDFDHWLQRVVDVAARAAAERHHDLRVLDRQRLEEADWFQRSDMIGYTCYVDRFAGDLGKVVEKIPYLKELGVTYLHLLPVLAPREGENDGGYAIADYRRINPQFGAMEDLRWLAGELRRNGISLCLDLVCNHTADTHDWAIKAKAGESRYQDYYHLFPDRSLPDRFEATVAELFPQSAPGNFTYSSEMEAWVWTTFYGYQWDLNYSNPAVLVEMLSIMLDLANLGVEVFRLDAVIYMWKRLGTDCTNQPEVHSLLQVFRAILKIAAPAVLLKAEAMVTPQHLAKYLGLGESADLECHLGYHNVLMVALWASLAKGDVTLMGEILRTIPPIPAGTAWISYIRCHDDIGWSALEGTEPTEKAGGHDLLKELSDFYAGKLDSSFAAGRSFQVAPEHDVHGTNGTLAALTGFSEAVRLGDKAEIDFATRRILLLYAMIFGFGGIPLIYMGDEIGAPNDETYRGRSAEAGDGRWLHRPFMDWDAAEARHGPTTAQGRLFAGVQRLVKARKSAFALHAQASTRVVETGNDHVFGYLRRGARGAVLVLANFSAQPQTVARACLDQLGVSRQVYDWISGTTSCPDDSLCLEPYDSLWLEAANGDETGT